MTNAILPAEKVIIVDWGTTSLRAALVALDGSVLDEIETQRGIHFIPDDAYQKELMEVIAPWLEALGTLPVIALGMITSRNGWIEVPYVSCPATAAALAAGTVRHALPNGSTLTFLAGITDKMRTPFPDVMRGEETQIVGFGLDQPLNVVLPGTHSKWAQISLGCIQRFQTFVTGEVFALMSQHSFIAKVAPEDADGINWSVFERGVQLAMIGEPGTNPLLSLLFSARTGMLANELQPVDIRDFVSGILIGNEFRGARDCGWFKAGDEIGIIGNDGLNARYGHAAKVFGLSVKDGGEDAAIHGALAIYAVFGEPA